jgi:hypothetical protein
MSPAYWVLSTLANSNDLKASIKAKISPATRPIPSTSRAPIPKHHMERLLSQGKINSTASLL